MTGSIGDVAMMQTTPKIKRNRHAEEIKAALEVALKEFHMLLMRNHLELRPYDLRAECSRLDYAGSRVVRLQSCLDKSLQTNIDNQSVTSPNSLCLWLIMPIDALHSTST